MKETELAEQVVGWLEAQNWTIYQEVQFRHLGGVADIVAERNGILWIIETKLSMSIEVLNQASAWPAHYRSIAVPGTSNRRNNKRDYRVARDYYLVGVIEVSRGDIYESVKPPAFLKNHKTAKKMISQLTELHKTYAKAGSKAGSHLTPYKMTMIEIQRHLKVHPGCTIDDLFKQYGSMHYASKSSFKGNLLKCLDSFEADWCRIDKSSNPYKLYLKNTP